MSLSDEVRLQRLTPPTKPVSVVIDTDTFNEVDDQFALVHALLSPEKINIKAIYAAPFHNKRSSGPGDGMEKSYQEILEILELVHVEHEPPVYRGSAAFLSSETAAVESDAAHDLIRRGQAATEPLYVIALGALTNIASALLLEPQFGTDVDDIGTDVVISNGRVYVLSEKEGSESYYDEYYDYYESYDYEQLDLQLYDGSGNFVTSTSVYSDTCNWDYGNCGYDRLQPQGLYADGKGSVYVLHTDTPGYWEDDEAYEYYNITKLDQLGNNTTYRLGRGSDDSTKSVVDAAVDSNGNIYVAKAEYTHNYDTWTGTYTNVVAKYSTTGVLQWQRSSPVGTPYGITVSSTGSVYVVGTTGIARYTGSGGLTWSKAVNNSKGVLANAGNIVVSGSYIYTRSGKDIRKYDGNGRQLWLRTQSGLNTIVVQDMDGDGSGNLYLSGKYQVSTGNMSAYVRKLNASGSILWTKTYGTPAYDDALSIVTTTGSEIYTTGETQGSLAHPNRGGRDGYLRKQNSTGGAVWNR